MNLLEQIYNQKCREWSDIQEHLPTLKKYAEECNHITEFGVRTIVSTYALLMGKPKKMISYDYRWFDCDPLIELVKQETDFSFIVEDVLKIEIEETDLLFIDTLHNYDQCSKELELHGNKSKRYIIFHDTTSFEWVGESYEGKKEIGLWPAIQEFIDKNPHWKVFERFTNNNGLTILKRTE